jgi:hypothetical protein
VIKKLLSASSTQIHQLHFGFFSTMNPEKLQQLWTLFMAQQQAGVLGGFGAGGGVNEMAEGEGGGGDSLGQPMGLEAEESVAKKEDKNEDQGEAETDVSIASHDASELLAGNMFWIF